MALPEFTSYWKKAWENAPSKATPVIAAALTWTDDWLKRLRDRVEDVADTAAGIDSRLTAKITEADNRLSSGKAPMLRKVTAGEGLIGGGDLGVDIAFKVDFGSQAGQARRGNDAALVAADKLPTTTPADGDLLYASGGVWKRLARPGAGKVLGSGSSVPAWIDPATSGASLPTADQAGLIAVSKPDGTWTTLRDDSMMSDSNVNKAKTSIRMNSDFVNRVGWICDKHVYIGDVTFSAGAYNELPVPSARMPAYRIATDSDPSNGMNHAGGTFRMQNVWVGGGEPYVTLPSNTNQANELIRPQFATRVRMNVWITVGTLPQLARPNNDVVTTVPSNNSSQRPVYTAQTGGNSASSQPYMIYDYAARATGELQIQIRTGGTVSSPDAGAYSNYPWMALNSSDVAIYIPQAATTTAPAIYPKIP